MVQLQDFTLEMSEDIRELCAGYTKNGDRIQIKARANSCIKRGLRNDDGTGVMIGYTNVGAVYGYSVHDGERVPEEGRLIYRGYELKDLVAHFVKEQRFGYLETAYLLLLGELPNADQSSRFQRLIRQYRVLPENFTEDFILNHPSPDIMNKLGRCVLSLYSMDPNPDDVGLENMMRQSIELVARFPMIVAYAYCAKRHYYDMDSLYLHRPMDELSTAENFLRAIRPDASFTHEEARMLDICLVCHAEHGGGNNSTFTCRSAASTGTDTYSAIAAAVGSLKGPKHGGANSRVMAQFREIQKNVRDWKDDEEVAAFVRRILNKEVCDRTGLVYGMGHAVYTLSDPRTVILKQQARRLAREKGMLGQLELMEAVERVTPAEFAKATGSEKVMCANVDMYSGLVYQMLNIPQELYTPLFAIARIAGWCAHRMEEELTGGRIYRPAYKATFTPRAYVPREERT